MIIANYLAAEAAQLRVGGQAVIEGVMMRAPRTFTVVVRKPDGELAVREDRWYSPMEKWPLLKKPFLISTMKPRKVATGFPPPMMPCFLTLSVTPVMVALSGRPAPVLKDRRPRYCFLATSSPR